MANCNPLPAKSKLSGPSPSLKVTPSNSPLLKPPPRSYNKQSFQSSLSLQAVIGTTTSGPNGFSSHEPSRSFALCAGSAAILAELDEQLNLSQRFFRARPNATGLNHVPSYYNHGTAPNTPDTRPRSATIRPGNNGSPFSSAGAGDPVDSSQARAYSSRERVKAVTSVSLSPNGRLLAVGETGYSPRVLIFSTAKDAPPNSPLSILSEHTSGVRGLAFSPNSQFLASLGDVNDGFLFVWTINLRTGAAKLHSTNKCTSFVRDMCWINTALVTVGTRHIKVWRLGDTSSSAPVPAPVALSARNCLLGDLVDSVFTCIASISDTEAVICTEAGAVCLFDDTGNQQKLRLVKILDFGIYSVAVDFETNEIWLGGRDRRFQNLSFDDLRASLGRTSPHAPISPRQIPKSRTPAIVSMGIISSQVITVDSTRAIRVCSLEEIDQGPIEEAAHTSIPAHDEAVLGVGALKTAGLFSADIFTWSSDGVVSFWDLQGKCHATRQIEIELLSRDDENTNELKILRAVEEKGMFVSGDKYGVLRTIQGEHWHCTNEVRAHGGEITDIAIQSYDASCLVASSGKDRMIQLFDCSEGHFDLIQTMDDHVAGVSSLLFANDGQKLLSSSPDRTVIIRDRLTRESHGETTLAFMISKVITLKSSPMSMIALPNDSDGLVLSTVDRHVHKYDITSGRHIHSFRTADSDQSDAVVMGSLTVENGIAGQFPSLLIGVSTTDKSIRVYDIGKETLLAREFGHTEGVSDVMVLHKDNASSSSEGMKRTLVSTGHDGVIMIWELSVEQEQSQQETPQTTAIGDETPSKDLTAVKPPLRRILSKSELAGFQKLESPSPSPTPIKEYSPPRMRRKASRLTSGHSARNGNSPSYSPSPGSPLLHHSRRSPTSNLHPESLRHRRERSTSPSSPRTPGPSRSIATRSSGASLRRPSIDFRARPHKTPSSTHNEFGSLNMSTEQVCRTLRAFRRKLGSSSDHLQAASELEHELKLTSQALTRHSRRTQYHFCEESSDSSNSTKSSSSKSKIAAVPPTTTSRHRHVARRMPSTPNLGQAQNRTVRHHRANSMDAKSKS